MKHLVKIPRKLGIAGHDYSIKVGVKTDQELQDNRFRGTHSDYLRRIRILSNMSPQETSCTFIHECFHAIDIVYCASRLSEDDIKGMANGFHQVLEQLGVRFIK